MWNRLGFMVMFSHLEGILNVALLLSLIVQFKRQCLLDIDECCAYQLLSSFISKNLIRRKPVRCMQEYHYLDFLGIGLRCINFPPEISSGYPGIS